MLFFLADGRLGNQIFQYAFLKTIARKNEKIFCANMKLFFETFDCESENIKHYQNKFVIRLIKKIIVPYILKPLSTIGILGLIKQNRDSMKAALPTYTKKDGLFPFLFVNTDFFQSESFFTKETLFSEVKIKDKYMDEANKFLSNIPDNFVKVFVHIRRGDYTNEIFMGTRGIDLPKLYFNKSIAIIKEKIQNPFFVFLSDDPSYVERCFEDIEPKIISKNSMKVDLAIMSLCNAGIISNSSFSWWGSAFMRESIIVIAPRYWYGWKQKVESHHGIYPSRAYIIDVNEDTFPVGLHHLVRCTAKRYNSSSL